MELIFANRMNMDQKHSTVLNAFLLSNLNLSQSENDH